MTASAPDYRSMWTDLGLDLGLDLDRHDALPGTVCKERRDGIAG